MKVQKYMNAKYALVVIGEESTPKGKENVREDQRGCKRERKECQKLMEISGEMIKRHGR